MPKKTKWKKLKKGGLRSPKIGWAIWALTILFALVAVGKLISFVSSLDDPFRPDGKVLDNGYSWDGNSTLNVVIKSGSVYLLTFNPINQNITILKVPDETYFNLPFEYGAWPARSIYDLGQSEKEPSGASLLSKSVQFSFGIPVDGYIILEGKMAEKPLGEVIDHVRTSLFGWFSLIGSSRTDLNLREYLKLAWGIKGVRFDKIKEVDLAGSQISKWLLLKDGSRVLDLDQAKLDLFIQKNFQDQNLNQEGVTVGIFNSTKQPGLAEKAARIVTNMGGRVILTANFAVELPQSLVLAEGLSGQASEKSTYSQKRLSEVFAPWCLEKKKDRCQLDTEDKVFKRAEINIVLGQDFAANFIKK